MRDGLARDEALLLVVTPPHWEAIHRRCRQSGCAVDTARASGRLVVKDAEQTLSEFMYRDMPDWHLFNAVAGTLIRDLHAEYGGVRVYGEAVDVLVRQDQFTAAECLEEFWNRLTRQQPLTVFCSYTAEHFGNPRHADALRRICGLHTHVQAEPHDILGSFLLKTRAAC